ncbi:DUF1002 domain-containing protein [Bacillus massiliigorillae]|uniref:DUF1002 domain-containing protein n=1 Tax=Bacillus massiliigorillae TaxID=1243664 RepID=UPI0003A8EC73|nr:DUF1002 domain-containing protein [Bacillus massiliigorillae]
MKRISKKIILAVMMSCMLMLPIQAFADAQVGDSIVTLGKNLTVAQKEQLLKEMNVPEGTNVIEVTNEEEHQYLGQYVSKALIGTRALSSSKITIGKKGSGIIVKSHNIDWVSDEMFINALATAGVKDAEVYVTAPMAVSGTAALTGVIKAYEITADKKIPEEVKQAANEEMVTTAKLGDQIGTDEASALMTQIKDEISKNPPQNTEDVQSIVDQASKDLNIELTEAQKQSLTNLFDKLKDLNINWNAVGDQLTNAKDKLTEFLSSEEGQGFLDKVKEFFVGIIDWFKSLFQ